MKLLRQGLLFVGASLLLVAGSATLSSASGTKAKGPYTFGVIDATTGTYGPLGIPELNGIELAVKQINAAGGVGGHHLAYKLVDDEGSVSLSTVGIRRLALQDKLPVILGPGITAPAEADAPLAEKFKTMNMNFVSQSVTWEGKPYVSAMLTPQAAMADAMLKYMSKVDHVSKVYILNASTVFGNLGAGLLTADASKYGITVVGSNTWDITSFDFTSQATQIVSSNPPGVLLWGAGTSSDAQVLSAVRAAGYTGDIVGDVSYTNQDIPQIAGSAATTVVGMSQINYAHPNAVTKHFLATFKAAYGHLPTYQAGATYDSVYILAKTIEKAHAFTSTKLVHALIGLSYNGVNGSYSFSVKYRGGPGSQSYVPITFDSNGQYKVAPTS